MITDWILLVKIPQGLTLKPAFNEGSAGNCAALNAKKPGSCAWASVQFDDAKKSWSVTPRHALRALRDFTSGKLNSAEI